MIDIKISYSITMVTKIYKRVKFKSDAAPAKRAEVEARAGREGKEVWGKGIPAPPERKLSKFSVWIFLEKSSDFVQDRQPSCKVCVSRLARGFAPRFGGQIFKQFPNEPIIFRPSGERKATIIPPQAELPKSDIK